MASYSRARTQIFTLPVAPLPHSALPLDQEENQRPLGKLCGSPNTDRVSGSRLQTEESKSQASPGLPSQPLAPPPSPLTRRAARKSQQYRGFSGHGKASCGSVPQPRDCSGGSPSL